MTRRRRLGAPGAINVIAQNHERPHSLLTLSGSLSVAFALDLTGTNYFHLAIRPALFPYIPETVIQHFWPNLRDLCRLCASTRKIRELYT